MTVAEQRKRRPASHLDREFSKRGLLRTGVAARLLHISPQLLARRVADGVVKRERFEVQGSRYNGIPRAEVLRMHKSMWPVCPFGCSIAQEAAGFTVAGEPS